jgi:polar amino acid transport system substrate-binding protein
MVVDAAVVQAFTPTGVLRASINLGNPILAKAGPPGGEPTGVSVDLARAFARRLGVPVEFVVFDTAGKVRAGCQRRQGRHRFLRDRPLRGASIAFTAAYVLIEGCYLVRESSPITQNEQVDKAGVTVTVGLGSAYDLYLSRELQHASIVRAPSSPTVVETFVAQNIDVAAGVKQQLELDAQKHTALRLLPGRFMVIQQAMGTPKTRGEAAAKALHLFVEEMKATGFVAKALAEHKIEGASVAPAG